MYIKVRVVNVPIPQLRQDEQPSLDPDRQFIIPAEKQIDPNDDDQISADLNGDLTVDLQDFAVFTSQYGRSVELPLTKP